MIIVGEVRDAMGVYETALRYGWSIAVFGTTLLIFLYLWKKGRLDMDEGPKQQMLDADEEHPVDREEEER